MSDPLFQGSLQDMIKGMRSNKKDPSTFLSKEIADIKTELRSTDPFLKAEAVSLNTAYVVLTLANAFHSPGPKVDISANDRL